MKKRSAIKRVNLSLPQNVVYLVQMLAERDDVTLTTKATELLEQGLEAQEDLILVEMAEKRLQDLEQGTAKTIPAKKFRALIEADMRSRKTA